jgi:hypothetical protein
MDRLEKIDFSLAKSPGKRNAFGSVPLLFPEINARFFRPVGRSSLPELVWAGSSLSLSGIHSAGISLNFFLTSYPHIWYSFGAITPRRAWLFHRRTPGGTLALSPFIHFGKRRHRTGKS